MLPDTSITLHFMITEMTAIIKGLGVYPNNMLNNLNIYGGVVFSQRVLLALVENGMSREDSYRLVQKNAHSAWNQPAGNFKKNLENDPEIKDNLSSEKLSDCFSTESHQSNLRVIWERLGI